MYPPTSRGSPWTFSPTWLAKCSRWQFEHTASLPSFDGRVESQHQQVFSVLNVDSNTGYELVSGTKEKGKDSPVNGTSTSVGPAMRRSKRQTRGSSWLLESKNEVLKIPLTKQTTAVRAVFHRRCSPFSSPATGQIRVADYGGPQSEWISITGSKVGRDLNDVAVVIHLHELARVFGRPACGRNGQRLEWLTKIF